MALAQNIGGFRREPPGNTFRGWLRGITRHKVADYWRKTRGAVGQVAASGDFIERVAEPVEEEDSDQFWQAQEANLLYRRALELIRQDFEERTWQAFLRVATEDQSPTEVAAALGMTVNAVYLAKGRVLARLREEFADLMET